MTNFHSIKALGRAACSPSRDKRRRAAARAIENADVAGTGVPSGAMNPLTQFAASDADVAVGRLGATENGLPEAVVADRLTQYGPNEVAREQRAG